MEATETIFTKISGKSGDIGLITLNRPKALNALTQSMCIALFEQLKLWANDSTIKAVIVQGEGERAFCAGGDIRYFYEQRQTKDILLEFFQHEYRLDQYIFHYPKPYISLLHGITMGGGAGISINGKYRIAAENLILAMPETAIGFHPDIGAGYFLTRCPNKAGFYLGLTGARINAIEAKEIGLIDFIVPKEKFPALIATVAETKFSNDAHSDIDHIMNQYHIISSHQNLLSQHQVIIERCFSEKSMEEIIKSLQKESNPWAQQIADELLTKSPTSLKVTLRKLQESNYLNFDDCMQLDYRLTTHFIQHQDFYEGIRAAIIHKDRTPKWQPATLVEVSEQEVEAYFK